MAFYKVKWRYRSALWPEPLEEGNVLQLTEAQAAMLNADSPGVVEPVEMIEKPKEEPRARMAEGPPQTTARRGPASKR